MEIRKRSQEEPQENKSPTQEAERAETEMEIEPRLRKLFEIARQENPELASAKLQTFTPKDKYDSGGYYDFEEGEGGEIAPTLFISEGSSSLLAPLLEVRKEAIRINASLLGINPEEVTTEILQVFIFAHELGHIKDFLRNYKSDPSLEGWEAVDEMGSHRDSVLMQLPVPNLSPTHLIGELREVSKLEEAIAMYPEIKRHPKFSGLETVQDLLRLQEEEYRGSEPERYADEFAAELLTRHAQEFGIPIQKDAPRMAA